MVTRASPSSNRAGPAPWFRDRALRGDLPVSPRRLQPLSAPRGKATQEKAAAVARSEEARGGRGAECAPASAGDHPGGDEPGPASQGIPGSKGVPLLPQTGGCRAGTGGPFHQGFLWAEPGGTRDTSKGTCGPILPQSSPALTHKAAPGAEWFLLSHLSKEPPDPANLPGGL